MIDISFIFDRLYTTFAVNAAIELFGSMMAFFAIISAWAMHLEKRFMRFIILAGLFTFISAVGDAFAAIFRGMPGVAARWTVIFGNFFCVAGLILCAVFYVSILFNAYGDVKATTYRIFQTIIYALGILMMIILVVSQFTGWMYTIDEDNLYRRGPLFFLSGIYTLLNILCSIAYLFVRRKQTHTKISMNAVIYIAIPSIGILLQLVFYGGVFLHVSLFILMFIILFREQMLHTQRIVNQTEALAKTEIELAQARGQLLLNQVQPHFIYNTLSSIKNIEGNPEETKRAITEFANYIRGNLAALDGKELIPFSQEIELVRDYVSLQKRRFPDRFNVVYDLADEDFSLPPLSVQILVENSIKHGIVSRYENGTITIRSYRENNCHVIKVIDDGVGFDTEKLKNTDRVGLRAVKNRLEFFLNASLSVKSEIGKGTEVTLAIPTA